ncbi:MAG: DUF6427 family protein [Bacteroidota bacterium]
MLLKAIQKGRFGSAVLITLMLIALWLTTLLGKAPSYSFIFDSFPMPFYGALASYLNRYPFWLNIVSFALFFVSGIYLLALNNKYIILKSRSYLPALFFALCAAAFLPIQRLNPALVSLILVLLSIDHLFAIYQNREPLDNLFRAGLAVGMATLFYAPAVTVAIWALLTLLVLRSFNVREWFVLIFAFTVPWLIYMLILFIANADILTPYHAFLTSLFTESEPAIDDKIFWIFLGFLAIPFGVSLISVFPRLAFQKIIIRRYFTVFLYLFLIGVISFFVIPGVSYEIFYIIAVPSAFIFSSYFSDAKPNFWNELLLWLPIIGAILVQVVMLM